MTMMPSPDPTMPVLSVPLLFKVLEKPATLEGIVTEMFTARTSERQGHLIDSDEKASMEKKKKEGYF